MEYGSGVITAEQYKQEGNDAFRCEKFEKAISLYSRAITKSNGKYPSYFTNRALARLRLNAETANEQVIEDADRALSILDEEGGAVDAITMKAFYFKGQAQLALSRPNEAYTSLARAFKIAMSLALPSVSDIHACMMQARFLRWEKSEKLRVEQDGTLGIMLKGLIEDQRHRRIEQISVEADLDREEREQATTEINTKVDETIVALEGLLSRSDERFRIRNIPNYLLCPISLSIFIDPVIGLSGRSYERSAILRHLKIRRDDPFTRAPLHERDLISNIALREAAEDFLKINGWAAEF